MSYRFQPPFRYIFFIMLNIGVLIPMNLFFWKVSSISIGPFLIICIFEILLSLILWKHGEVASIVKYAIVFSTLILLGMIIAFRFTRDSCGMNCYMWTFLLLIFTVFRIIYIIQLHFLGKLVANKFLQAKVMAQKLEDETRRQPLLLRRIPEPVLVPQPRETRKGAIGFENMAALEAGSSNKTQPSYGWAV